MQLHTQVHTREAKPYKCSQCTKSFANSSYLSQHNRIHLGIKPYHCDLCQRKFTQLSHLQQHSRTHTGDKPYKCRFANCNKSFSQLSNLQSHSRSHQTDKPFKCNSCYKCFTDEAALLEHIPKHKDSKHLKTHICQYCGKSYTQQTYLAKHLQKHEERSQKRATHGQINNNNNNTIINNVLQINDNYWQKNAMNNCQASLIECTNNNNNNNSIGINSSQSQLPSSSSQHQQCQLNNNHEMNTSRFDHHTNRLSMSSNISTIPTNGSHRLQSDLIYNNNNTNINTGTGIINSVAGLVESAKNGSPSVFSSIASIPNSTVPVLSGANVRVSPYLYESINFNKISSGMDAVILANGGPLSSLTTATTTNSTAAAATTIVTAAKKSTAECLTSKTGHTSSSFPNQLIALHQIRNYASMPVPVSITSGNEHPISLKDE